MYDEKLGKWHFWITAISANVLFFPMHFVGLAGMPRRIPDYSLQFAEFNAMAYCWRLCVRLLTVDLPLQRDQDVTWRR